MRGLGIGGDQAQAAPARNKFVLFGACDEPVAQFGDGGQRPLGASLHPGVGGKPLAARMLRLLASGHAYKSIEVLIITPKYR
jgi:hypothetical protein